MDTNHITKNKTTYNSALEMARTISKTEDEAVAIVRGQIDEGLVGDPNNRKTCNWKFEGTDMTINPSTGPNPKKSSKLGANNARTHDLNISSKLLEVVYEHAFESVKALQQEGTFSKIDATAFVDEYKEQIVTSAKRTMLHFLENNTVK